LLDSLLQEENVLTQGEIKGLIMDPILPRIVYTVNQTRLCGPEHLVVWNSTESDLGSCFQNLFLVFPAQVLLAVTSAYYLGFQASQWYLRSRFQKQILACRSLAILMLLLIPMGRSIALYNVNRSSIMEEGEAGVLAGAVQCFSWSLHLMYSYLLYHRISLSVRGPTPVIVAWSLCFIVDCVKCHTIILHSFPVHSDTDRTILGCAVINLICQGIYLLTLIPAGDQRSSQYEEFGNQERRESGDPLLPEIGFSTSFRQRMMAGMTSSYYGGFREGMDPYYLGVAKDPAKVNWLNRLFFVWVNPLISKGGRGRLRSSDDVYDLPEDMTVYHMGVRFKRTWEEAEKLHPGQVKILRILYTCYGRQFFSIGVLKFVNDCSGFAGPILLNLVVNFVEDQGDVQVYKGYIYALLLSASAFICAMSSCHFNLLMAELGLKVRGAMSSAVYQKVIHVSKSKLSKFNSGQIINFMSTDVDRVVNFSPSLHAAWSLPFQFIVTLILLYQQVGISFLTGLVFTLLIIPVNKCIANRIGSLSTSMMSAKDDRVNLMSELLGGVRVIKYFNWTKFFTKKVNERRKRELKYLQGRKYLDAACVYLWATTPVLISVLTFVTYVLLGNQLTAAKVFTSLALFSMLTGPLNAFPWVLNGLIESFVSLRRLDEFMALEEFNPEAYFSRMYDIANLEQEENSTVVMYNASFVHNSKEANPLFRLENLNLSVLDGELVGIIGPVGSGKSSMLELILGELERVEGAIAVDKPAEGIGFVTQDPWLQEGNIRDNILFGTAYQHTWYSKVTDACALVEDFKLLGKGDMTNVGEKGSKLSGGQKARISLARAVYQNKKLYLIDDIFSAVDGHVAAHIYRKCILGLLKEKTVILCTHQTRYLSAADTILALEDGKIKDMGAASTMIPKLQQKMSTNCMNNFSVLGTPAMTPMETGRNSPTRSLEQEGEEDKGRNRNSSQDNVEDERMEQGRVKAHVYFRYLKAVGSLLSPCIFLSLAAMQITRNLTDVWLAHWVSEEGNSTSPNTSLTSFFSFMPHERDPAAFMLDASDPSSDKSGGSGRSAQYYLIVYGTIALGNSFFSLLRAFLFAYGGICAARRIHSKLLRVVLRGKIAFFDNTPVGRILNRFSSDLYTVDDSLPFILNIFLANAFGVLGPLIVTVYALPWIILILIPLCGTYYSVQTKYRPASREIKRIGSVAMSPLYSHFSETLAGVSTIRAMNQSPRFIRENEERLESSIKATYAGQAAGQWLELRLQMIGCCVVGGVAIISILQHHLSVANAGMVGLAISYALGITGRLSGLVSSFTETERELVAVERCVQYLDNIPPENQSGSITITPYGWPSEGVVSLKNVVMRYQPHLPKALKGISFTTRAAEKVGIVGRTGSGKSSIFQCLYRLIELESGEIYIDNVKISQLELGELREHLVIIPQHPFLFSGSIRENLDPDRFCSDRQLLDALKKAKLDRVVSRLGGLDFSVTGEGTCFSAGQKQLFCLARAVLSPARIVLIDEATANVDLETDHQIQEVIQSCLADRTILTIAHRVDTVLGCDRVIVLEDGYIVETGHPNLLLQDGDSKFSKFVATR